MFKKSLAFLLSFLTLIVRLPLASASLDFGASSMAYEVVLKSESDYQSSVLRESHSFSSVAVHAEGDFSALMVDFGEGWEEVELHDDYGLGLESLIFTEPTEKIQFKAVEVKSPTVTLRFDLFYTELGSGIGGPPLSSLQATNGMLSNGYSIVSRAEWGADESIRVAGSQLPGSGDYVDPCAAIESAFGDQYTITSTLTTNDQGQTLTWPIRTTAEVEKFTVHHTDSDIRDVTGDGFINSEDYRAIVRAIYSYHTKTRGWGDIGYNYLIDPLGNIYEGRVGGDKSIGGHAMCYNAESIGIALIGNFENQAISEAAFESLSQLIGQKSKQYDIDPLASGEFRGLFLDNVYAHKDVRATSCPGEMLYSQLDQVRVRASMVMQGFDGSASGDLEYNAEFMGTLDAVELDSEERKTLTLAFKNTGTETWDGSTWLHVAENQSLPYSHVVPMVDDKRFVAADLVESSVSPGETGTFKVNLLGGSAVSYHTFQVSPVVNGKYKISRAAVEILVSGDAPHYDYELVSHTLPNGPVFQGQEIESVVRLKNTGDVTWYAQGENRIVLATEGVRERESTFVPFGDRTRMGYLSQPSVAPGAVGDFKLNLHVPETIEGEMIERFTPVIENTTWLQDKALGFKVDIQVPYVFAKTQKISTVADLYPGEKYYLEVEIENKGNMPWDSENVKTTLLGRGILVPTRFLVSEKTIQPGEVMTLGFWIQAPLQEGYHSVYLRSRFQEDPIRGAVARYVINVSKDNPRPLPENSSVETVPMSVSTTPDPADLPQLPGASADVESSPFRVRLSHESDVARLTADTPFVITDGSGSLLFEQASGFEVQVARSGTGFLVTSGDQTKSANLVRLVPKERSGITDILSMERRPSWNTDLNDNRFRGVIEMRLVEDEVAYINELPLEDYLRGLAEVSNTAPTEKQKVIAVLARSYAQYYMDDSHRKFPNMPYDGSDDPNVFQRYLGYGFEMRSPTFVNAVAMTDGMVVTYEGELIKTPYFSQSDGRTRSAEEVWGWTDTPYLKSVDDSWSNGLELAGHGVGLSGYGATKQAEAGKDFEEIIKYYYQGVEVESL